MPKHAYLSASASHRWLACPPSAKLCANITDQTSEYAQQGTDCHELCAYLVEKALGRAVTDPTESLTFYDAEMQNCAEEYRNYVLEQIEAAKEFCKDPQVMIEQRLDFSRWVENGFGTGDCVIVADEVLQMHISSMPIVLPHLASLMQTVSLSLRDPKYIPVSTAELPSISTLLTATATRELLAVLIISRSFETANLLAESPELRMISLLMKKTISLNKSNVTTTTKQAVVMLPPVTIKESR